MADYDINAIQSLSFRDGVRTRIQMYLGSDDIEGTYQALKEIINNSTDEALAGYGDVITVTISEKENTASVNDFGRGVPFGVREDGENVLVSIYSRSHTGGKFNNSVYKNASGLNGIGAKCVCLSSEKFEVRSIRDGKVATAYFEKGELKNYKEAKATGRSGTWIRFKPDPEVFKNGAIGYSYNRVCEDIHNISYLYPGLTFIVKNEDTGTEKKFMAEHGIVDFVKDNLKKPVHKTVFTKKVSGEQNTLEIAFQWGAPIETSYVFVNGLQCPEGGTPITGAKSAITRVFNNLTNRTYNGEGIRRSLFYVINCQVAEPSFANQTKSKINNADLRTLASEAFTEAIKEAQAQYPGEFEAVVNLIDKFEKAEKAADAAREAILNHEKETTEMSKKKILSNKLRDARQLGQDATLLVVEGLSAGGSMSVGRDPNKYGILMLRGKAINCLSASLEDILANEEVKLLLQALGVKYGEKYNPKKLRYGRLAIATDSDADGRLYCL